MNRRYVLAILVLALLAALLLPAYDLPHTRFFAEVENAAHGPIFGCVALFVLAFLRAGPRPERFRGLQGYLLAAVTAIVLGGAGELAQLPGPRDASWGDFLNDVLGAGCALFGFACLDPALRPLRRGLAPAFALASALFAIAFLAPLAWVSAAYVQRAEQLPVLLDPASRTGRVFVYSQDADLRYARSADGGDVLDVLLAPGRPYPGIELSEPWPDWRGKSALVFEVENPGAEPTQFNLHIRDAKHDFSYFDRFNAHYVLQPGRAVTIRVPMADIERAPRGRRMDLARMTAVVIFGSRTERPRIFRLRAIRLE